MTPVLIHPAYLTSWKIHVKEKYDKWRKRREEEITVTEIHKIRDKSHHIKPHVAGGNGHDIINEQRLQLYFCVVNYSICGLSQPLCLFLFSASLDIQRFAYKTSMLFTCLVFQTLTCSYPRPSLMFLFRGVQCVPKHRQQMDNAIRWKNWINTDLEYKRDWQNTIFKSIQYGRRLCTDNNGHSGDGGNNNEIIMLNNNSLLSVLALSYIE